MINISYIGSQEFGTWLETAISGLEASAQVAIEKYRLNARAIDLLLVDGARAGADATSHATLTVHVIAATEQCTDSEQSADSENGATLSPKDYVLLRGPYEARQLRVFLELAETRAHTRDLSESISSPFAHDVRGVIGVVNLAAQILSASEQNAGMTKKLLAVGFKMSELLETLQAVAPFAPDGDDAFSAQESYASMIESIESWFGAAYRSRVLEIDSDDFAKASYATQSVKVIVRGMIDACTRYSPKELPVKVRAKLLADGDEFEVGVDELVCSDEQRASLLAAPSSWIPSHLEGVPWRLWVAQRLAAGRHAELSANRSKNGLVLRFKDGAPI